MEWILSLRLIRLFDFYLILGFFFSTLLRIQHYRTILAVVRAVGEGVEIRSETRIVAPPEV